MDSGNLLFSAEDDVDDESAVFLNFKKAEAKKEKKLTLNAAFKQVFGEALEPLGFKVVKSKYPYLVRVINDEIIHVISIRPRHAEYPEDKAFSILGGIATVYRKNIDLNTDPMENYHWLRNDAASFYLYSIDSEPDRRLVSIMSKFNYFSEVPKSLPCVMEEALEYAKKYMISYMNETNTLEKCIDYLVRAKLISTAPIKSGLNFTSGDFYDDGLIYLKTNYKHHKERWEEIIERKKDISEEKYNKVKEFYKFFSDDEYIQGLANELDRRKAKILETLKKYGIIYKKDSEAKSPAPPKKLTLKSAFTQVFGEALEPLGFKKVKSKYPYYVRVINDEIVQVISFYNEKDGDYQTYTVVGGIATPYRKKIDFSVRPSCHMEWLGSNSKYYFFSDPSDYSYQYDGYLHEVYLYQTADSNKLLTAMKQSFEDVKKWMLPVFNDITTIDDTIIFYLNYHSDCFGLRKEIFDQGLYTQDNEILLLSQIQNEDLVIEKYIQKLKQHNEFEAKIGRTACQVNIEKAKEKLIDSIQYLKYNKKYLALANEYKIRNTEILKNM